METDAVSQFAFDALHARLAELRGNQAALARELGVKPAFVSVLVNGKQKRIEGGKVIDWLLARWFAGSVDGLHQAAAMGWDAWRKGKEEPPVPQPVRAVRPASTVPAGASPAPVSDWLLEIHDELVDQGHDPAAVREVLWTLARTEGPHQSSPVRFATRASVLLSGPINSRQSGVIDAEMPRSKPKR